MVSLHYGSALSLTDQWQYGAYFPGQWHYELRQQFLMAAGGGTMFWHSVKISQVFEKKKSEEKFSWFQWIRSRERDFLKFCNVRFSLEITKANWKFFYEETNCPKKIFWIYFFAICNFYEKLLKKLILSDFVLLQSYFIKYGNFVANLSLTNFPFVNEPIVGVQ